MTRIVCVGDSFTEGMVDASRADGRHLGWADRVARGLAEAGWSIEYANLAIRGKLLDQVIAEQVPLALEMAPDLITFQAGLNDVLRPGTDIEALLSRYDATVARLVDTGAEVVLFTGRAREGWNRRIEARLGPLFDEFNANARRVAEQRGCRLVDLEAIGMLSDRRCWGIDRLHLNDVGHQRVASAVLASFGLTDEQILGGPLGWWHDPLPPASPRSPLREVLDDVAWAAVHLAPWVMRRVRGVSSGDGLLPKDALPRVVTPQDATAG